MSAAGSVLVIGGASDIGRAIARVYAEAGRPVVLAARNASRLQTDATDIQLRGGVPVTLLDLDILDSSTFPAFLDAVGDLPGTVISVVGLLGDQAQSSIDPAIAETVMRTNYIGPALLLGEIANRMERRGSGTIIGISSVAGDRGRASNYIYGSAKAGFTAFLSGLRNRLATKGVHVVTIKPGFVDTQMTKGMKLPPLLTASPLEVANAVAASEQRRRDIVYVRPIWRVVMGVIGAVPEKIFKTRMKS
jgi:decaprenylphospho-beta-D-erythro-pentofuranosid-2-ulose 2-reductase